MQAAADCRRLQAAVVALVLALGLCAAPALASEDPYAMLEACRSSLQSGRLEAADAALSRLKRTLQQTPGWDPDGTFRQRMIPELEGRIKGLKQAVARLEALYRERWDSQQPPARLLAEGNMRAYVDHITDSLLQIQEERDAILADLPSLEDRAILDQIPASARIETTLNTGVLQRLHNVAEDLVERLHGDNETVRALTARLEQLRKATVDMSAEREQTGAALMEAQQRLENYLGALAAMVTEGASLSPDISLPGRDTVDDVFATLISQRTDAVRRLSSQTPAERDNRLAAAGRYRHYNDVLLRAQVARDRSDSLDELANLIDRVPVTDPDAPLPPLAASGRGAMGTARGAAVILLLATAGSVAALLRRRRSGGKPESKA